MQADPEEERSDQAYDSNHTGTQQENLKTSREVELFHQIECQVVENGGCDQWKNPLFPLRQVKGRDQLDPVHDKDDKKR